MRDGSVQHHHLTPRDWDGLARAPLFRRFIASKRRFIVPTTIFFLAYFLALPLLVGFAPQVMGRTVWGPLTLAYAFAISQFAMAWVVLAIYLWRARSFDEREAAIVDEAREEFAKP